MKIIILGGGPAGCSAAYYLHKKGLSNITVVEKNKIGGLCETRFCHGIPYEYGPQILYTDDYEIRRFFNKFLKISPPPTANGRYQPLVSTDGTISGPGVHNFPITFANVLKFKNAETIIEELYNLDLKNPDYSSFENYAISRLGKTLYQTYVRKYNVKQWLVDPAVMDAEWAKFRPFTLRRNGIGMFNTDYQGHPGDYNNLWSNMLENINIVDGFAEVSDDFKLITVNGDKVDADLVISTLPLHTELEFVNTCLVYVLLESEKTIMGSYATSFPNNYDFVRIMEYRQQYSVESNFTLLDFQFSWDGKCDTDKYITQVHDFIRDFFGHINIHEIWYDIREKVYPISTRNNLLLVENQLHKASESNVVPMGRMGVHAYVSKDTCIKMGVTLAHEIDTILYGEPNKKAHIFNEMRKYLT